MIRRHQADHGMRHVTSSRSPSTRGSTIQAIGSGLRPPREQGTMTGARDRTTRCGPGPPTVNRRFGALGRVTERGAANAQRYTVGPGSNFRPGFGSWRGRARPGVDGTLGRACWPPLGGETSPSEDGGRTASTSKTGGSRVPETDPAPWGTWGGPQGGRGIPRAYLTSSHRPDTRTWTRTQPSPCREDLTPVTELPRASGLWLIGPASCGTLCRPSRGPAGPFRRSELPWRRPCPGERPLGRRSRPRPDSGQLPP